MKSFRMITFKPYGFKFSLLKGLLQSLGIISMLLLPFSGYSQSPKHSLQAQISADSILLGDQVEFSIRARISKWQEVEFPFVTDTLVTGLEVLRRPTIDTVKLGKDSLELRYYVTITSFQEGYYRIPPYGLPFEDENRTDTLYTKPLYFLVNTIAPDSTMTDIYDVKEPISEPITFAEVAPWAFGSLLLIAAVLFIVYYIIRRHQNKPIFFPSKPAEPAHVIALRKLNEIKEQKLWETDDHKQYYTALIDTLRQYMELRFGNNAMEQTTFEIVSALKAVEEIDKELLNELSENLLLSDLVKFARFTPTLPEKEGVLQFGFRFVNKTKEEEQPTPNEDSTESSADMGKVVVESSKDKE